ncbi:hypothetical protein O4H52_07805 [Sphingomonadaceae bacterium G21617-S1]|nr:hypothetical protein [Sphingomonadaceae bacterium G21617-S1]
MVGVVCKTCGRVVYLQPAELIAIVGVDIGYARQRLKCRGTDQVPCGSKDIQLRPVPLDMISRAEPIQKLAPPPPAADPPAIALMRVLEEMDDRLSWEWEVRREGAGWLAKVGCGIDGNHPAWVGQAADRDGAVAQAVGHAVSYWTATAERRRSARARAQRP